MKIRKKGKIPRSLTWLDSIKLLRWGMSHPEEALDLTTAIRDVMTNKTVDPGTMRKIEDILAVPRGELFDYGAWELTEGIRCSKCGNSDSKSFTFILTGHKHGSAHIKCSVCGQELQITKALWAKVVGDDIHERK